VAKIGGPLNTACMVALAPLKLMSRTQAPRILKELLQNLHDSAPLDGENRLDRVADYVSRMVVRVESVARRRKLSSYKQHWLDPARVPKYVQDLVREERPSLINAQSVADFSASYHLPREVVLSLWGVKTSSATKEQRSIIESSYAPFPTISRARKLAEELLLCDDVVIKAWNNCKKARNMEELRRAVLLKRPISDLSSIAPAALYRKADEVASEFFLRRSEVMRIWRT